MTHEEMMARGRNPHGEVTIERLDPRLKTGEDTYLFNIYNTEHQINLGTAGQYYVPPCPAGETWVRSPTVIPGTVEDIYPHFTDKEEYRCRPTPGEDVVKAALGIGVGQGESEDIRRFGVFASHNSTPTKAELAEAKKRLVVELQRQLRKADQLFASADPMERKSIDNEQFYQAARFLNVKKPWMSEATEMSVCPFCTSAVGPNASICGSCKEIINPEAYAAMKKTMAVA